uniref:Uncharacterized protein n=1 Tax=Populus alba TaxID=43335 RepID=A0A4U5N741_POPAL|nr:hypothetical protein D5086_0000281920 [Populus alba]
MADEEGMAIGDGGCGERRSSLLSGVRLRACSKGESVRLLRKLKPGMGSPLLAENERKWEKTSEPAEIELVGVMWEGDGCWLSVSKGRRRWLDRLGSNVRAPMKKRWGRRFSEKMQGKGR